MGRKGSGVELRANSIRLTFQHRGRACKETLRIQGRALPPTPANVTYAHRVAKEIRRLIESGRFDDDKYKEYFAKPIDGDPDSAGTQAPATFGALADAWLATQAGKAAATHDQYAHAVRLWKRLLGIDRPLHELTHAVLAQVIGKHPWSSSKSLNNYLIAIRGILKLHYRGRLALDNPMIGIENRPVVKKRPDPLSIAERDKILADMAMRYDPRVVAYFQFQFFSGLRPEETIALRWADLDVETGTLHVRRVRTFRGSEREGSKTHAEREVDLVGPAINALLSMKPYTFDEQQQDRLEADIFQNPVTGRPWHDERSQRDHYWAPSLARCGIRRRRAYATRHTFCTAALMSGVNPAYIAAQAGHNLKMLLEVYAKWIPGGDGGTERDRLRAALAGNSSPILPQPLSAPNEKAGKPLSDNDLPALGIGRRDWTRTNDPHHVKVVL